MAAADKSPAAPHNPGLAVYVHWPFCLHMCPYCDFNSHVRESIDESRWAKAYIREIARLAEIHRGGLVSSVFFGGGTPSLMSPDTVVLVLRAIEAGWGFGGDVEITLEGNPTSIEAAKYDGFRQAGINRVSLGLQALNDGDLARLGRQHSAAEGLAALELAQARFDSVSFDLIYAREGQSLADWGLELRQALGHAGGHLSLYQLTIEPGTQFFQRFERGDLHLPGEETEAAMYELTQDLCAEAGLPAYEISNHARPGQESRHNLAYWRYQDYVGVGPGAHGRVTVAGGRQATRQQRSPEAWIRAVEAGGADLPIETLSVNMQAREMLMMGLRTREGVDSHRFQSITGLDLRQYLGQGDRLDDLQQQGFLEFDHKGLRLTQKGRPLLNAILNRLLN